MQFGSDGFFQYIKETLTDENTPCRYEVIYETVKKDIAFLWKRYDLSEQDKQDIEQEIQLTVRRNLVSFVLNSEDKDEKQRNTWLKTVAIHKVNDYFSHYYKKGMDKQAPLNEAQDLHMNQDGEFCTITSDSLLYDPEQDLLSRLLREICEINTTPDKIMAFIFSKVIPVALEHRRNGVPKEVIQQLGGKKLGMIFLAMKRYLRAVFQKEIPDYFFAALEEKLQKSMNGVKWSDQNFQMNARGITDSGNWISKKLKHRKDEIIGDSRSYERR